MRKWFVLVAAISLMLGTAGVAGAAPLNWGGSTTFIIATHDQSVMRYAKRIVRMRDGRIVEDIDQHAA